MQKLWSRKISVIEKGIFLRGAYHIETWIILQTYIGSGGLHIPSCVNWKKITVFLVSGDSKCVRWKNSITWLFTKKANWDECLFERPGMCTANVLTSRLSNVFFFKFKNKCFRNNFRTYADWAQSLAFELVWTGIFFCWLGICSTKILKTTPLVEPSRMRDTYTAINYTWNTNYYEGCSTQHREEPGSIFFCLEEVFWMFFQEKLFKIHFGRILYQLDI